MGGSVDVISHPGKLLKDHLRGVRERAISKFDEISRFINWKEVFGYEREKIRKTLEIAALYHDAAKSTSFFQEMMKSGKKSRLSSHSELSSVFVFNELSEEDVDDFLKFCGYAIVRYHHSHLQTWMSEPFDENLLSQQIKSILGDEEWQNKLRKIKVRDVVDRIRDTESILDFSGPHDISKYFLIKLLYSILVSSDWEDAANLDIKVNKLNFETIEEYVNSLKVSSPIDDLRKDFHESVVKFKADQTGVFTITAPTGIGKTLANSALGLKLSGRGNLFYSLPLVNIIEQTSDTLKKIFGKENVLEYHHLSDLGIEEGHDIRKLDVLARTWNYPIVVTTFVSLLENLIGPSKAPFLHRLVGNSLVLDEVQAVPHEKWRIVKEVIEFLPKLGVNVILSTATMPVIFSGKSIGDFSKYYEKLDRVNLRFKGRIDFEDFKEKLGDILSDGKKTIIIANTVKEAEEIYDSIDQKSCFLSSRVLPKHRRERIRKFKEGMYDVCVSTQVIEAGVDVSAERVIRDLAPMDGIFQAAGRCNRHFEYRKGEVMVFHILSDGKSFSKRIYGRFLTDETERTLRENPLCRERDFKDLIEKYYKSVTAYGNTDEGKFLEKMEKLDFNKLSEFSVLNERGINVSFLVIEDEEAQRLFEKLERISEELEGIERAINISTILRKLSPYTVNTTVWNTEVLGAFEITYGRVVIHQEYVSEWYDPVKGLRLENGGGVIV